jgi:hypothetical protein
MHCDYVGCAERHIGKYDECVTEALHVLSLEGFGESTGDVDAHGYFTALTLDSPENVELDDDRTVIVPAGYYILSENDTGFVHFHRYDTNDAMLADFQVAELEYSEWLGDTDN